MVHQGLEGLSLATVLALTHFSMAKKVRAFWGLQAGPGPGACGNERGGPGALEGTRRSPQPFGVPRADHLIPAAATPSQVFMVVLYSLTTSLGIAIGIGVSASYDPESPSSRAVQGTLNGVSGGALM
jgi:hypothetical protein